MLLDREHRKEIDHALERIVRADSQLRIPLGDVGVETVRYWI
jgi:hypothetical protein